MPDIALVCGPSCAGKTVGALFLADRFARRHIEASVIMRRLWSEAGHEAPLDDFAADLLLRAPETVPVEALRRADGQEVVISGLRAPAEVAAIFRVHPGARLIFVEARFEIRLDRALRRARPGHVRTADDLRALDRLHETMGLNAIAAHAKATVVLNEATLAPYREALTAAMLPG